ncbi:MAG: hypothetical protein H3C55_07800 [Pseudorhodoplanes sp.]|nr:hypothetical protein [Pseudorhodoplanes sp.]
MHRIVFRQGGFVCTGAALSLVYRIGTHDADCALRSGNATGTALHPAALYAAAGQHGAWNAAAFVDHQRPDAAAGSPLDDYVTFAAADTGRDGQSVPAAACAIPSGDGHASAHAADSRDSGPDRAHNAGAKRNRTDRAAGPGALGQRSDRAADA